MNNRFLPARRLLLCSLSLTVLPAWSAYDPPYPSAPIKLVVPFTPGAGTDQLARLVAPELAAALNGSVFVENRPGAGGNIGIESVVRAAPDGHTLLLSSVTVGVNKHFMKDMKFDPVKELSPVILLAQQPIVLVVNPSLPVKNVEDLVSLARSKPGALNYGSAGAGNSPHLMSELFKSTTKTRIVHIPYRGSSPATTALLAGEIALLFNGLSSTHTFITSGKLRALAITGKVRSAFVPDVPTFREAGLPDSGFEHGSWWGISAPAGTPKGIVTRLNSALNKTLQDPRFREKLTAGGFSPLGSTPEQYDALIKAQSTTWGKVIREAGIVVE